MNTKKKGTAALAEAVAYFTGNTESVFIPFSDTDKYDLVVDNKGILNRIQCKYSDDKEKSGGYIVDLRTFGGYREKTYHTKYLKEDFDFLFVLCGNGNRYLIPRYKIDNKSIIVLGIKSWSEYKI
jgi:hypothetical protein